MLQQGVCSDRGVCRHIMQTMEKNKRFFLLLSSLKFSKHTVMAFIFSGWKEVIAPLKITRRYQQFWLVGHGLSGYLGHQLTSWVNARYKCVLLQSWEKFSLGFAHFPSGYVTRRRSKSLTFSGLWLPPAWKHVCYFTHQNVSADFSNKLFGQTATQQAVRCLHLIKLSVPPTTNAVSWGDVKRPHTLNHAWL